MSPAQVGIIYSKAVVDIDDALNRLQTLEGRMKQLEGRSIKIDAQSAVRGLESLSKATGKVWDAWSGLAKGVQGFGDMLVHQGQILGSAAYRLFLVSAPLAAAGVASFKMAQDLETSMAMVATQLDLRGEDLDLFIDKFTKGFVDLSTEIPIAAKDMGDALYYLVSSMTIDPELAAQFIEPIAKIAVAGHSSAEEVAKAITPILNVYKGLGLTAEGIEHVGDVILAAVKKGRGEFSDFAVQVGDFIQFAEQAGATFEEAMAAFAMATRVTTPAQAATWIANLYRAFITPTGIAALQEMGIQTSEIVKDTGQWVTKTVELTDAQREQATVLQDQLVRAQENLDEATLEYQGHIDKAVSTWDEYTGSVQTSLKTHQMVEGVSNAGIDAWQRYRDALDKVAEIQGELAGTTAHVGETYQAWTGEQALRPSLELMKEIAEKVGAMKSEEEKLLALQPIFPRIRSMQGALLFIANLEEIVEWEQEFVDSTGLTQEMFEIMMQTFESKIGMLKNMFLALGFDLIEEYGDDLKNLIDGLTKLFGAFRELPADVKSKAAAIVGVLVALPAVLLGAAGISMALGSVIQFVGLFMAPGVLVAMTAAGVLFGDKIPIFLGALGAYGGGLQGFATSIGHLAVHFGLLSEKDAIGILAGLGIEVDKFDDQKIDDIATGIENIVTAVSAGIEDFKEWVQAFGDFLRDVQEREGAVGALVGYLERLWVIVKDVAGFVAPTLGIPEKPYEEWGREEKAGIIDKAMGFLIGSKIASWVFAGLAAGLKALIVTGMLLKAFGVVGTGAAGGGAVAVAGSAIGAALAAAIGLALGIGLTAALLEAQTKIDEWYKRRFPGAPPIFEREWMPDLPPEVVAEEEAARQAWDEFLGPWATAFKEAFTEHLIPPIKEEWDKFIARFTDYPGEVGPVLFPALPLALPTEGFFTPEDPTMERFLNFVGLMSRTETTPLLASTKFDLKNRPEFDTWIDKWDWANIEAGEAEHKASTKFDLKNQAAFDTFYENVQWLDGYHLVHIHTKYTSEGMPPKHLGGYSMDLGGYPPLNMPNILASEFVLSPHTTQVLENYLGSLDQQKIRSAVTHAPIGMTVNFFKGSVTSKEDAEAAADIIFDRMADRASGLALMET